MNQNILFTHPIFGDIEKEPISFYYEGNLLEAIKGQTVAAALMANGYKKLGLSRKLLQSRGVYCNNGRCYSCSMTINGEEHIRACMILVEDGMQVENNIGDQNVRGN